MMKCVCQIFVLTSRFIVIIFFRFRANFHMRSLEKKRGTQNIVHLGKLLDIWHVTASKIS